jgi:hypothetical protein
VTSWELFAVAYRDLLAEEPVIVLSEESGTDPEA